MLRKFFALTLLVPHFLTALPMDNPGDAAIFQEGLFFGPPCEQCWFEKLRLRVGFYGDYVYNRHLRINSGGGDSDIDTTRLYTNGGTLTLNYRNICEIYGILGGTRIEIDTPSSSFNFTGTPFADFEIQTESDFSWGAGARISFCAFRGARFGVDGRYFHANLPISRMVFGESVTFYPSNLDLHYQEWQGGIGYSQLFTTCDDSLSFAPYIAIKWSGVDVDMDKARVRVPIPGVGPSFVSLEDLKASKTNGLVLGFSVIMCKMSGITVEGRFADEKALHATAQLRF